MAEERNSSGSLILTDETMLQIGTLNNGEISLTSSLRLINEGEHTCDLEYAKINDKEYHRIYYWYFSKNTKINEKTESTKFKIDAKKGWNKIYFHFTNVKEGKSYYTTDLSNIPDGLMWLIREVN